MSDNLAKEAKRLIRLSNDELYEIIGKKEYQNKESSVDICRILEDPDDEDSKEEKIKKTRLN